MERWQLEGHCEFSEISNSFCNIYSEGNMSSLLILSQEIPQQKNGSDCGVFACKYADYIAKGRPLTFKQVFTLNIMDLIFFLSFSKTVMWTLSLCSATCLSSES